MDGDADRIGVFDSQGNFIDAHHVILLLIKYLKEVKNFDGEVITDSISLSKKIDTYLLLDKRLSNAERDSLKQIIVHGFGVVLKGRGEEKFKRMLSEPKIFVFMASIMKYLDAGQLY